MENEVVTNVQAVVANLVDTNKIVDNVVVEKAIDNVVNEATDKVVDKVVANVVDKVIVVSKKWYQSKTVYLNVIALVLIVVQSAIGVEVIPVQYQSMIVAVLNLVARTITNTNITI